MWPGWQKAVYTLLVLVYTLFPGLSSRISPPQWTAPNQTLKTSPSLFLSGIGRSNERSRVCHEEEFRKEKHTCTHMSTVASLKTAGDSTAGCPAVEGCVRQWAEQSQTGVRRTGSFLLQYEWLSGVPCQMKEARPRRSPKTYVKRLQ